MLKLKGCLLVGLLMVAVNLSAHPQQYGMLKPSSKPMLSSISPTIATVGSANLTLTASGTNFFSGAYLQWVGTITSSTLPTTYLSSTRLTATIPSTLLTAPQTVQVSVASPTKGGWVSNRLTFTIISSTIAPTPAPSPLAIATTSLTAGTVETPYSAPLAATGGTTPYSWKNTSSLPPGLSLASTGAVSGTPTTSGSYSFSVQVTDAGANTASAIVSLTIGASTTTSTLSISTASPLPNATVSTAYSSSFAATGGTSPYGWSVASGSTLPAGLSLSSTGNLSGTPTTASTYSFSVLVKDSLSNTSTRSYSLTVSTSTTTHKVALSWGAPTAVSGVTITGFNVYRLDVTSTTTPSTCPTPSSTSAFTMVGNTTSLNYTDTRVQGGHTYCYFATALAGTVESAPSNISTPANVP